MPPGVASAMEITRVISFALATLKATYITDKYMQICIVWLLLCFYIFYHQKSRGDIAGDRETKTSSTFWQTRNLLEFLISTILFVWVLGQFQVCQLISVLLSPSYSITSMVRWGHGSLVEQVMVEENRLCHNHRIHFPCWHQVVCLDEFSVKFNVWRKIPRKHWLSSNSRLFKSIFIASKKDSHNKVKKTCVCVLL